MQQMLQTPNKPTTDVHAQEHTRLKSLSVRTGIQAGIMGCTSCIQLCQRQGYNYDECKFERCRGSCGTG